MTPLAAAVFASGSGTNLQALLDHHATDPPWRVRLVVSNKEAAGALDRGASVGVPTEVIPVAGRVQREVADDTLSALRGLGIEVIFLAGYLKLIPAEVVESYRRRILNVHPALLPSFGGKGMYGIHVHRAVLASGARLSGPTVHYVDEEYDRGTIVAQWPVPVFPGDTPEALAARVLRVEHRLYPMAADHVCRALASNENPGPLVLPGDAFTLVEDAWSPTTEAGDRP